MGVVGGLGYWHYQGKLDDLSASMNEIDANPFWCLEPEEDGPWEKYRSNQSDSSDGAVPDGSTGRWQDAPIVGSEEANALEEEVRKKKLRCAVIAASERRQEKSQRPFAIVGMIGGTLAAIILLWNIIWHTGHWIWLGREK